MTGKKKENQDYRFTLDLEVRDYECDMQGIVNNAVYQNYLEHTRHQFIKSLGFDFAQITKNKIYLVVVRAELDFRFSLRSGDRFWVGLNVENVSPVRFGFFQDIYRHPDDRLILNAKIIGTAVNAQGRPEFPPQLEQALF